jgi:pimeloyl-ACP methyl ester carboxylesterase
MLMRTNQCFKKWAGWMGVGVSALLLAACGGGDGDGDGDGPDPLATFKGQKLVWQSCDPSILGDSGGATLSKLNVTLEQFGTRLRCATMRAPLDYAYPAKGELLVAFMRVAAEDPAQRKGAIMFNPGGPGGDGLVLAPVFGAMWSGANEQTVTGALYKQMARSFDLVGFSPRGMGASTRLRCESNETKKNVANETVDRTPANLAAMLYNARLTADACAKNPLTPDINSDATARDMDLMRHLLGDEKFNYYGISYGTWLGAWYAALFPERVGRMVLSGVVNLPQSLVNTFLSQPMGYQRAFDQVVVPYAARHAGVFSLDGSAASLGAVFATLDVNLQVVVSQMVTGYLGNAKNATNAVLAMVAGKKLDGLLKAVDVQALLNAGNAAGAASLVNARIATTDFARTPTVNGQSYDLNATARQLALKLASDFFEQISRVTEPVNDVGGEALAYVVPSNDTAMGVDIDGWLAATNRNALDYPLAGGLFTAWPGLYWGAPSVTRPALARATRAGAVVILQTRLDAQTPVEGAEQSLAALPNASIVLVRDDYTHGLMLPYGQACVDDPVALYFLNGTPLPRRTECNGNALLWDDLQPMPAQ